MIDSRRRRFFTVLFPALLAPLQVLLFGPHTVYTSNQQEFSAPFWTLAVHLAPTIVAITAALVLIGIFLPAKAFRYYVVGLVSLGIVVWIQGNLIVGNYGLLNGEDINWSDHAWRNRHEVALWTALPIVAIIAATKFFSIAVFTSRVLIALQLALMVVTAARADSDARGKWQGPPDAIFELSSNQNVFHFVLDGFQSDIFHDIVDGERAEMDRMFSGFTFFANHTGAFPTTIVSIPAMLTGGVYRNQEPMGRYIDKQFKRASLFGAMRSQGYQVDAVSGLTLDKASATNFFRLPAPYVSYEAYTRFAAWQLGDLALFRHSPHLLKPTIYNDQSWQLQTIFGRSANTTARRHLPVNGEAFLNDFTARMHVTHDRPVYKYVHVGVPHWPTTLTKDCEFVGVKSMTRERYAAQARCGVKRVGEFLDALRKLRLYDSSLIVVSSDHGVGLPPQGFNADREVFGGPLSVLTGSALALLVVKPPHTAGPLRISGAPTTISDIPATIVDALGLKNPFPGTPALKLDERTPRSRSFAMYPWRSTGWNADYFAYMDVFTIRGRALDGDAWNLADPIYAPDVDPDARLRGFHQPERGDNGTVFRWSSPIAFLHAPPDAHGLEVMVRSVTPTPQTVSIEIGGAPIDRVTLSDHEWRTLRYRIQPRAKGATTGEWVMLRVDPQWRPRGERRRLGVMTRNLRWIRAVTRD